MAVLCPVPARASIRDLLADLVGHDVTIKASNPQMLAAERPAFAAVYRRDDGTPAAVCICDADTALATGAAIGMMPLEDAEEEVGADGTLEGDLLEFFREVVNVLAKLLNSPSTPHVVLAEILQVPGKVPQDMAQLVQSPLERVDLRIDVDGYRPGVATLVVG